MKRYQERIPATEAKFEIVPIPGGRFHIGAPKMGMDPRPTKGRSHEVRIDPPSGWRPTK